MCTVTLTVLPNTENGFVLTSNRDEAVARKTLPPREYLEQDVPLIFPKDEMAGGTWIGLSKKKRAICLLNGGFEKHVRNPPYKKSRGLVVKELLASNELIQEVKNYNFNEIEPFTCVMVDWGTKELEFYELVWDGKARHLKKLPLHSYIWSSSLLYSRAEVEEKQDRFKRHISHYSLTPQNLWDFHSGKGVAGDQGLIIDNGFLKTCSITQITKTSAETNMLYQDLLEGEAIRHISVPST